MNQSYPLVHFEGVSMNSATKKIKANTLFTSDVPVNPILNSLLKTDLQKEESQPVEVPPSSVSTTAFEDAFPPVQNQPLKSFFDEPQVVKEETPEPPPQTSVWVLFFLLFLEGCHYSIYQFLYGLPFSCHRVGYKKIDTIWMRTTDTIFNAIHTDSSILQGENNDEDPLSYYDCIQFLKTSNLEKSAIKAVLSRLSCLLDRFGTVL